MSVRTTTRPRVPAPSHPREWEWTTSLLRKAIKAGIVQEGAKLELIEGRLTYEGMLDRMTQGRPHTIAVRLVERALKQAFGPEVDVQYHMPLTLGHKSEPEPDVAVIEGQPQDYRGNHPPTALLVVEVSDTTLRMDRGRKLAMYAAAGVPEYWILNLRHRRLEVHRDPKPAVWTTKQASYETAAILTPGTTVEPLFAKGAAVEVAALLP